MSASATQCCRSIGRPAAAKSLAWPLVAVLALLAGGCSTCEDTSAYNSWHATYVTAAQAAAVDPKCHVTADAPFKGTGAGAVDPDLLEIARLELERDCYRAAEERLREQVGAQKQAASSPPS